MSFSRARLVSSIFEKPLYEFRPEASDSPRGLRNAPQGFAKPPASNAFFACAFRTNTVEDAHPPASFAGCTEFERQRILAQAAALERSPQRSSARNAHHHHYTSNASRDDASDGTATSAEASANVSAMVALLGEDTTSSPRSTDRGGTAHPTRNSPPHPNVSPRAPRHPRDAPAVVLGAHARPMVKPPVVLAQPHKQSPRCGAAFGSALPVGPDGAPVVVSPRTTTATTASTAIPPSPRKDTTKYRSTTEAFLPPISSSARGDVRSSLQASTLEPASPAASSPAGHHPLRLKAVVTPDLPSTLREDPSYELDAFERRHHHYQQRLSEAQMLQEQQKQQQRRMMSSSGAKGPMRPPGSPSLRPAAVASSGATPTSSGTAPQPLSVSAPTATAGRKKAAFALPPSSSQQQSDPLASTNPFDEVQPGAGGALTNFSGCVGGGSGPLGDGHANPAENSLRLNETLVQPYGPEVETEPDVGANKRDYQLIKIMFRTTMVHDTYPCRLLRELGEAAVIQRHKDITARFGYRRMNRDDFHYQILEILQAPPLSVDTKDTDLMFDLFDANASGFVDDHEIVSGFHWVMQGPEGGRRVIAAYCKQLLAARNAMEAIICMMEVSMMVRAVAEIAEARYPGIADDAKRIIAFLEPLARNGQVPHPVFYQAVQRSQTFSRVVRALRIDGTLPPEMPRPVSPDVEREMRTLVHVAEALEVGVAQDAARRRSIVDASGRVPGDGGMLRSQSPVTKGTTRGLVDLAHPRFRADANMRPIAYRPTPEHGDPKWCLRNGILWLTNPAEEALAAQQQRRSQ